MKVSGEGGRKQRGNSRGRESSTYNGHGDLSVKTKLKLQLIIKKMEDERVER